jgi:hypothetical protein
MTALFACSAPPERFPGFSRLLNDLSQGAFGGDILAQIMRELARAIEEGRLKPVVVGPIEIGVPGQTGPGRRLRSNLA